MKPLKVRVENLLYITLVILDMGKTIYLLCQQSIWERGLLSLLGDVQVWCEYVVL